MQKNHKRLAGVILTIGYGLTSFFLFFYSYTQVDLSLTLSSQSLWQLIQKQFQHIGYFERPASAVLYIFLIALLSLLYFYVLYAIRKKIIQWKNLILIIGLIVLFGVFSYPAFSYDLFNYMFTAKTVLIYHKNPYSVIPLQFSGFDPYLNFMHWSHLPSAYAPLWIIISLVPYMFGFGYFLLTLFNFKILMALSYLFCIWCIVKILKKEQPDQVLFGVAIFAFNPLVIIESLVSAHNDIVMMALALYSLYLFLNRKTLMSVLTLALSVAVKSATLMLFLMYFKKISRTSLLWLMGIGLIGFLVVLKREILPWYFLWIVPFVALVPVNLTAVIISFGISTGLLLRYVPFLYFGHWNPPVPAIETVVTVIPIIISSIAAAFIYRFVR